MPDRGTQRFKSDAPVLAVVLDLAELCRLAYVGIEHETKRIVMRYSEHEHRCTVHSAAFGAFLHVVEQML